MNYLEINIILNRLAPRRVTTLKLGGLSEPTSQRASERVVDVESQYHKSPWHHHGSNSRGGKEFRRRFDTFATLGHKSFRRPGTHARRGRNVGQETIHTLVDSIRRVTRNSLDS